MDKMDKNMILQIYLTGFKDCIDTVLDVYDYIDSLEDESEEDEKEESLDEETFKKIQEIEENLKSIFSNRKGGK